MPGVYGRALTRRPGWTRIERRGDFAVADDRIEVRARDEDEAEWSRSPLPLLRQAPRLLPAAAEQALDIPPPAPGHTLRLLVGLTWSTEDGPVPGWLLPEPLEGQASATRVQPND